MRRPFFFNDTATTEIYTLSLHDALPIFISNAGTLTTPFARVRADIYRNEELPDADLLGPEEDHATARDRKSTRLNSSHANISYAVFCLKKKRHDLKLIQQNKTDVMHWRD